MYNTSLISPAVVTPVTVKNLTSCNYPIWRDFLDFATLKFSLELLELDPFIEIILVFTSPLLRLFLFFLVCWRLSIFLLLFWQDRPGRNQLLCWCAIWNAIYLWNILLVQAFLLFTFNLSAKDCLSDITFIMSGMPPSWLQVMDFNWEFSLMRLDFWFLISVWFSVS